MASRRTPVEDVVDHTPAPQQHNGMEFDAEDLALPRMRVVGKDADLVNLGIAQPCDVAIGAGADDPDSTVYPAPGNVTFMVLAFRSNYTDKFGGEKGSWQAGDPAMPDTAKKTYHYTLCVPDFDTVLPVTYTAGGGAAAMFRRINTLLAKHTALGGGLPYELGFTLSTEMKSGTIAGGAKKSWPAPVLGRVELTAEQLVVGAALYETVCGAPRTQLESGDNDVADL